MIRLECPVLEGLSGIGLPGWLGCIEVANRIATHWLSFSLSCIDLRMVFDLGSISLFIYPQSIDSLKAAIITYHLCELAKHDLA